MSATGVLDTVQAPATLERSEREHRWDIGFAGLLFFLIVQYASLPEMYPVLQPLHAAKLAIGMAVLGYLAAPRGRLGRVSGKGVDVGMWGLVIVSLFSALLEIGHAHVWNGFVDVVKWAVIFFLVSRVLTSRWRLKVFLGVLLLLNLKLAQFAVRGYAMDRMAGLSNMQFILRGGAIGGTNSFFGNAGDLGVAMCVVWGITWALLFRKGAKRWERIALGVCFLLFFLTILVGGTRGAIVAAAAIVLVALLRTPKKIGAMVLVTVFVLALVFVLPGATKERFSSAVNWRQDPDTFSRLMFWQAGLEMWKSSPLLGVGPARFPYVWAKRYFILAPNWSGPRAAHSVYIQVLSELGLGGALALVVLVISFLRLNAKTRKRALASSPEGRGSFLYCLAAGLDLGLVGYLVGAAFLAEFYYPHLWILMGLSVATHSVCAREYAKPPETRAIPSWKLARVVTR
ncbi:MAG TPA: O-antigen ligase family protein [Candidatus Dormibacteraeota bacterium]|nr:O-antigen ligase family protein [Candidatus Dormibacteraeota bacterium]